MKFPSLYIFSLAALLFASACNKDKKLDITLPEKYEGHTVELMDFADSTVIATTTVKDGKAEFLNPSDSEQPIFTQLIIDGRTRAFYILEKGTALLTDSMSVASGTPLNDQFAKMMIRLDSVENLDDISKYTEFVEQLYNENKENVFGNYFGIEWLKYAEPQQVDSLLAIVPESFRNTKRVKYYENFAKLRAATAPGNPYTDFAGEDENGKTVRLKNFIRPGRYTMVDFWASWCPYCINELPDMKEMYAGYKDKGLDIVGVAVRDKTSDTLAAIEKFGIPWPSLFNTQKTPYDIYGFSGIPHHILIGPDGVIISRNESVAQISERLKELLADEEKQD